jgi:sugar lactone lactonase YvrE
MDLSCGLDSKILYFSDSHSGKVLKHDFDPLTRAVGNRRHFIDMKATSGVADCATIDA